MNHLGAALPRGARRTAYDVPGSRLAAVEVAPAAPRGTVLLVSGFTGSKEDFAPVLPALAEGGWRAVAIDQRGQYESPGADDPSAYTVAALAEDVLAVADALGAPLHLLGHSFGGLVCRQAVLARPDAFYSLVLMCSGPAALPSPRADVLGLLRPLVQTGGMSAVHDANEALDAQDATRAAPPPEVRAFLRERFLRSSPTGLLGMGDALLSEPDQVGDLAATGLRLLVLHGEGDDAWPPPVQRDMAERLGAAYEVVPQAAHSPAVENPEATGKALLAFWG